MRRYAHRIAEIRRCLADSTEPLTLAEIAARCASAPTTTQVGCAMYEETRAGRVCRHGDSGQYRYALTDTGRAAAADPNLLRRGRRRRTRGNRRGKLGVLLSALIETGA